MNIFLSFLRQLRGRYNTVQLCGRLGCFRCSAAACLFVSLTLALCGRSRTSSFLDLKIGSKQKPAVYKGLAGNVGAAEVCPRPKHEPAWQYGTNRQTASRQTVTTRKNKETNSQANESSPGVVFCVRTAINSADSLQPGAPLLRAVLWMKS